MTEKQVAGVRFAEKLGAAIYHAGHNDPDGLVWVELGFSKGGRITAPLTLREAQQIERGDNITVTVEITREP